MATNKEAQDAVVGCIAVTVQAITFLTAVAALIISIVAL